MNKIIALGIILPSLFNVIAFFANAASAFIFPSILGVLQIFTFPPWMLFLLFGVCVLVDSMIFKDYIKKRKGWILLSIGCNIIAGVVTGFTLFYFSLMLAFNFKHVSEFVLFIITILLLALVTLIDVIIQIILFNLLFSITDFKKLSFKLFIGGFLILAGIILVRIVLHI